MVKAFGIADHGGSFGGGKPKKLSAKELSTTPSLHSSATITLAADGTNAWGGSVVKIGADSKHYYFASNTTNAVYRVDKRTNANKDMIPYNVFSSYAPEGFVSMGFVSLGTVLEEGSIAIVVRSSSNSQYYVARITWDANGGKKMYYLQGKHFSSPPRLVATRSHLAMVDMVTPKIQVLFAPKSFVGATSISTLTTTVDYVQTGVNIACIRYNPDTNMFAVISHVMFWVIDANTFTQYSVMASSMISSYSSNEYQLSNPRFAISHDFKTILEWTGSAIRCLDISGVTPTLKYTSGTVEFNSAGHQMFLRKNGMLVQMGNGFVYERAEALLLATINKTINLSALFLFGRAMFVEEDDVAYGGYINSQPSNTITNLYWTVETV